MGVLCPICSDSVNGDMKTHLMKHFKYKKYPCADPDCDELFYTENERKLHCDKSKHKRCFQETVNNYLEMMVEMVSKDATLMEKLDYSTIVESRKAAIAESSAELDKLMEKQPSNGQTTKRKRTTTGDKEKEGSASKSLNRRSKTTAQSEDDSTVTTTSNVPENVPQTPSSSSGSTKKSETKKKKIRNETPPLTIPEVLEKSLLMDTSDNTIDSDLTGFYDPNDPNRKDWSRVTCNICEKEVEYDYICRKTHAIEKHLPDHEPKEFDNLYKETMDGCFPDLPNSDNACQLCMGGDVRITARREHIEKRHSPNLIDLKCPVNQCGVAYTRQCDLGAHMRSTHKEELSKYKNKEFQDRRKRRNAMISVMTNKCFPMTQFTSILKLAQSVEPRSDPTKALEKAKELSDAAAYNGFSNTFANDVRVLDLDKTRRAPIYNQGSSSSSSDEDEDEDNNKRKSRKSISEDVDEQVLDEDEVIFMRQTFDSQVMQKLKEIATIKSETARFPEEEVLAQPENVIDEENEEKAELCLILPPVIEQAETNPPINSIPLSNEQEDKKEEEPKNDRKQNEEVNRPRESSRYRESSTHSERRGYSSQSTSRNRHTPYRQRDSYLSSSSLSYPSGRNPSSSSSSYYNRNQSTPRPNRNGRPNYDPWSRPPPRNY